MNMQHLSIKLGESNIAHTLVLAKKSSNDMWIQDATKNMGEKGTEGALHRYFKIPEDERIPTKLLRETLSDESISEKTRKRIQFALNVRKRNSNKVEAKAKQKYLVTFRIERSGKFAGTVTAVFPETYGTYEVEKGNVMCYSHVGQHGEASLRWYNATDIAKPEEYADLLRELRGIYENGKNAVKLVVEQNVNWNKLLLKNKGK